MTNMIILIVYITSSYLFFEMHHKMLKNYARYTLHSVHCTGTCTVVSHIYTYDRAQNILNFVQQLQKLIL